MTAYPRRLRLHGAPGVHAARLLQGDRDEPTDVACHHYTADPRDQRLPDDTAVTCDGCQQISGETS